MKILNVNDYYKSYTYKSDNRNNKKNYYSTPVKTNNNVHFKNNIFKPIQDYIRFKAAQKYSDALYQHVINNKEQDKFIFRLYNIEPLEGLQYGIKVFKDLSMKEIQYMSENLHVIAVKRGCNHMCGHCYADAKPAKTEMSWEDFTSITKGFKTIRERLHGLDIYGENIPVSKQDPILRVTELFYDSDCMDLAIKDKKGNEHDFIDLSNEIYNSMGRKNCFDTSGWQANHARFQERAEKYAKYYSDPENMKKLEAFNVSFNPFNATYIASVKALKKGDTERATRLRDKFTTNVANTLFTFTPLVKFDNFGILSRCFPNTAKNAQHFNYNAHKKLTLEVLNKLSKMYNEDLNGAQKFIKTQDEYIEIMFNFQRKMSNIYANDLNPNGRMGKFMEEFNIKAQLENYENLEKSMVSDLQTNGRFFKYISPKLIDTNGRVYHMNYARFIPTEIQLNISGKDKSTPKLANLIEYFKVTKKMINEK